jgi:hypothetical protein
MAHIICRRCTKTIALFPLVLVVALEQPPETQKQQPTVEPTPTPTPFPTPEAKHCWPHQTCDAGDCCSAGTSCNTCPYGFAGESYFCAWRGLHRCNLPVYTPAPTPPTPLQPCAPPSPTPPSSCSVDDLDKMWEKGAGTEEGTFPEIAAACGGDSYTFIPLSFLPDSFVKCITEKVGMSDKCAQCFSGAGQYGFSNCKGACLSSWKSPACLACSDNYKPTLQSCVVGDYPSVDVFVLRPNQTLAPTSAPSAPCEPYEDNSTVSTISLDAATKLGPFVTVVAGLLLWMM